MHWAKRSQYNREWFHQVFLAKNRLKIFGRPELHPVALEFELNYASSKPMDEDNLIGSLKPIIDALTKNGIILDDDPDNVVSVNATQKKVPRQDAGTAIWIRTNVSGS